MKRNFVMIKSKPDDNGRIERKYIDLNEVVMIDITIEELETTEVCKETWVGYEYNKIVKEYHVCEIYLKNGTTNRTYFATYEKAENMFKILVNKINGVENETRGDAGKVS